MDTLQDQDRKGHLAGNEKISTSDQAGQLIGSLLNEIRRPPILSLRRFAGPIALGFAAVVTLYVFARSQDGSVYEQSLQQVDDWLKNHPTVVPGISILSATVNLPSVDSSADKEEFDYSGWKEFSSSGLTLKYPSQKGWEKNQNHLLLIEPSGNVPVRITISSIDLLKNKMTFASYTQEQYDLAFPPGKTPTKGVKETLTNENLSLVVSLPVNLPALKAAGLRGELIARQKYPGPDQLSFYERHLMLESFESKDRVIDLMIEERPSSIDYSVIIDLILKSAKFYSIPGIQR